MGVGKGLGAPFQGNDVLELDNKPGNGTRTLNCSKGEFYGMGIIFH